MADVDQVWSRFSDGHGLYLAKQGNEAVCFACAFVHGGGGYYTSGDVNEVILHVARHRQAGHSIPTRLEHLVRDTW